MRLLTLLFILIYTCNYTLAQNIEKDNWLTTESSSLILDFSNPDSLSFQWPNSDKKRSFPIQFKDSMYIILQDDIPFDTLEIISKEKYRLHLFQTSQQYHTKYIRGNNQFDTDSLIQRLESSNLEVRIDNKPILDDIILKKNHFLRDTLSGESDCVINPTIYCETKKYGLVVDFSIRGISHEIVIGNIYEDRVSGISIDDGSCIEIIYTEKEIVKRIAGNLRNSLIGTYVIIQDSTTLLQKIEKEKNSIPIYIGYSNLQLNEDGTFIIIDKSITNENIHKGLWFIFKIRNTDFLILEGESVYSRGYGYIKFMKIRHLEDKFLILENHPCNGTNIGHGESWDLWSFNKSYFKKLGINNN